MLQLLLHSPFGPTFNIYFMKIMCIFIYFIYAALMVELLFCCIEASSFLFMQLFKDCFIVLYFYGFTFVVTYGRPNVCIFL